MQFDVSRSYKIIEFGLFHVKLMSKQDFPREIVKYLLVTEILPQFHSVVSVTSTTYTI